MVKHIIYSLRLLFYLLAVLGFPCCADFYLVAVSGDYSTDVVLRLSTVVASPVAKVRL